MPECEGAECEVPEYRRDGVPKERHALGIPTVPVGRAASCVLAKRDHVPGCRNSKSVGLGLEASLVEVLEQIGADLIDALLERDIDEPRNVARKFD